MSMLAMARFEEHHDRAIERNVIEVEFGSLDLFLVFFREIAERNNVWMAVKRIAVEADFGVETDDLVVLGHDQRIDLEHSCPWS